MVVAIERQILEGDLRQLEICRRHSDQRSCEQAIDGPGREAADEASDLETCHAGLLSMTRSVSVEPHDQDRARRSVNDPCGGAAEPQKLEATAPLSSNHHELRGDRFGISDDDFAR